MKKIELQTTFTIIGTDGYIKPTSPIWRIENNGYCPVVINGTYYFEQGSTFGVDASTLVAKLIAKGIAVENDTTYQISFVNNTPYNYTKSVQLIQTFVKPIY